jgi:putative flippase GtrA
VKRFLNENRRFLLYCAIGGSGTALTCLCYALLVTYAGFNYQAANAIGYGAGTLLSFLLNAWFNFRVADRLALRLACFLGVAVAGWMLSAALLELLVGRWHWHAVVAYGVVLTAVLLFQYNLNRLVSFRRIN